MFGKAVTRQIQREATKKESKINDEQGKSASNTAKQGEEQKKDGDKASSERL